MISVTSKELPLTNGSAFSRFIINRSTFDISIFKVKEAQAVYSLVISFSQHPGFNLKSKHWCQSHLVNKYAFLKYFKALSGNYLQRKAIKTFREVTNHKGCFGYFGGCDSNNDSLRMVF